MSIILAFNILKRLRLRNKFIRIAFQEIKSKNEYFTKQCYEPLCIALHHVNNNNIISDQIDEYGCCNDHLNGMKCCIKECCKDSCCIKLNCNNCNHEDLYIVITFYILD